MASRPVVRSLTLVCLLALSIMEPLHAEGLLHGVFQDHVVLQRERPINVWGTTAAGEKLTIELAGATTHAAAGADGRWQAALPALPAGGPHQLSVRSSGGATQTVQDVLIGDVWLCSGQSNMDLQVHRTLDARAEIAGADNDSIRMVKIAQTASAQPLDAFRTPLQWQPTTPDTVRDFSATCFYFARELQKTVRVPMGLINASWGGSRMETWMSENAIRSMGIYDVPLDVLMLYRRDPAAAARRWTDVWQEWWLAQSVNRGGPVPWRASAASAQWRPAPADLGPWESWGDPALAHYNGMVWYRKTLQLTKQQAAQSALLALGAIDEVDQTWVNGEGVGNSWGPQVERRYPLPRGTLKAGENVIIVNALDTYGSGGLIGPPTARWLQFADGSTVSLDGPWQYQIAPADLTPPRAPWEPTAGFTMLYNSMIAPLGAYSLRGALWYQGESNTGQPETYEALLHAFMTDWRKQFGPGLPFLIVQLANYGPAPTKPQESGWAALREAQRHAVAKDGNAGLAVAIDIGDRYDIHPTNKQEVGRRLARAARRVVYGEAIAPSGPVPRGVERQGDAIVVTFADVQNQLVAYGAEGPIGFELCGAAPNSCRYVGAKLQGDRVLLDARGIAAPARVRYCWADSPICTLFDEARLPAGPFEAAIDNATRGVSEVRP